MALATMMKSSINRVLERANLRLESLTVERIEQDRLKALENSGHFSDQVFLLPSAFKSMVIDPVLEELPRYVARFTDFEDPLRNAVGYTFENDWFSSPDAEILYTFVRRFKPRIVVEVGSGNSTRVIKQAILDSSLRTRLIAIDPCPRLKIDELVDESYAKPVQSLNRPEIFRSLDSGDILFIDSSHKIQIGNDVVFLYLEVLPQLRPGVLIHIHDIFLPYDYPSEWIVDNRWTFNEQYLAQCLLTFSNSFEVLWAGYYIQRTRPDFARYFSGLNGRTAKSLWIRKTSRSESSLS